MVEIHIQDLIKRFGQTVALNQVTLTINPSELYFLLGPSGCGKTTLLRSLAGFYIPESGSIFFGDQDVSKLEPHKRNTGMMFQSYALWPHKTVAENVAFGLEQQKKISKQDIKKQVDEALDSVKMLSYAQRKPNALSGGQQQRVALARALVVRPRCLLLDEPLSNLDAKLRLEMRTEIRRVCKEFNLTTVYVTHDQKEALSIADRMAVLESGNVLQVGSPLELYKKPNSRFVASFIGETNFIEGKIESAGAESARINTPLGEFHGLYPNDNEKATVGQAGWVSLRPECITLKDQPDGDSNSVRCRIEDAIYYGEVAHYVVRAGNITMKISELNPKHLNRPRDKDIYACVSHDDTIILKR